MPRLPVPGGDDGDWGSILNDFLEVSHAVDGTLNPNVVGTFQLQSNAVTNNQLDVPTQTAIATIASKYTKPGSGIPSSDLTTAVQTDLMQAANAYLKPTAGIPGSDVAAATIAPTNLTTSVQSDLTLAASSVQSINNQTPNSSGSLILTATNVGALATNTKLAGLADTAAASNASNNQVLAYNSANSTWGPATVSTTTVTNATSSAPGIIQLSGDIAGGDATAPQVTSTHLSSPLSLSQGGTGSSTQNFVDLSTSQTIAGTKTFSAPITGSISGNAATATTATTVTTIPVLTGDVSSSGSSNVTTVAKINGITLPGSAPVTNNVLTAISPTALAWQTPAAGVTLDANLSDIQPDTTTGTAVLGSTNKAADAGHQHALVVHNHTTTNLGGQIPLGGLSATGTANSTTYLRGDGTWMAPPSTTNATSSVPGVIELAGDLAGSATSPSVVKINGITLPGSAPSTNAVLTATSATTTSWTLPTTGVSLDSTASDIAPLGVQAAGTNASAARADHVHGMPRLDQISIPIAAVSLNSERLTTIGTPSASTDAIRGADLAALVATNVVVPSNSPSSILATAQAKWGSNVYLASGTADDTIVQTAINAAKTAGGGIVLILPGTLNFSGSGVVIDTGYNVSLRGTARDNTTINVTSTFTGSAVITVGATTASVGCDISDLSIVGTSLLAQCPATTLAGSTLDTPLAGTTETIQVTSTSGMFAGEILELGWTNYEEVTIVSVSDATHLSVIRGANGSSIQAWNPSVTGGIPIVPQIIGLSFGSGAASIKNVEVLSMPGTGIWTKPYDRAAVVYLSSSISSASTSLPITASAQAIASGSLLTISGSGLYERVITTSRSNQHSSHPGPKWYDSASLGKWFSGAKRCNYPL
jgi:hypothetical protein